MSHSQLINSGSGGFVNGEKQVGKKQVEIKKVNPWEVKTPCIIVVFLKVLNLVFCMVYLKFIRLIVQQDLLCQQLCCYNEYEFSTASRSTQP